MKKITVTNAEMAIDDGNKENPRLTNFIIEGPEEMDASDGYHTFTELYDHRITLFIALCRELSIAGSAEVWRSKEHHIGGSAMYDGWFVMGINKEYGTQISYHLPIDRWEQTNFADTLDNAPAWDGHTPADVLERIKNL